MSDGDQQAEFNSILRALRDHVEAERGAGARWFPHSPAGLSPPVAAAASPEARTPSTQRRSPEPVDRQARASRSSGVPAPRDADEVGDVADLAGLSAAIGDCRRCKLSGGRTHIVFGVGNPDADLMFVGEGPGRDEDLKGEPFVGRAGQLLTEIITKGMKLRREDVYIANVIKCRPPQNRNPEPDEIEECIPFLHRQIDLVQPKVLVALGKFAAQTLLGSSRPITRMRGEWHDYRGVRLMPTLHPAYLLRNPADKRLVWADIKQVMAELGLPI